MKITSIEVCTDMKNVFEIYQRNVDVNLYDVIMWIPLPAEKEVGVLTVKIGLKFSYFLHPVNRFTMMVLLL
jgi:hypothetical protein